MEIVCNVSVFDVADLHAESSAHWAAETQTATASVTVRA